MLLGGLAPLQLTFDATPEGTVGPSGGVSFPPATVTVIGGSGVYTYNWQFTAIIGGIWSTTGGTTATATPSISGIAPGGEGEASLYCDITDTNTGQTATTALKPYTYVRF